jgi:aspartyl-tRNA(Asn)/glutamyl-tRNA(Gln) amidotransferase subunit B
MRPAGSTGLGTRVEVKNLNSMKAVCGALEYEIRRQGRVLEGGGTVAMETRLWDEGRDRTAAMRSKEEAEDYRYFPEPDLLPVAVTDEMIRRISAGVPELPLARRGRFVDQYGLSDYNASVLTDTKTQADYFEECLKAHDAPASVANWVLNEVLRVTNERRITLAEFEIAPAEMGNLVGLLDEGRINAAAAREVMAKMVETGRAAEDLVKEMGLEQVSDEAALEPIVAQVLKRNPDTVRDYLGGKTQAVGALVGQVMRVSRGKADPRMANRMLRERLDAMED